MGVILTTYKSWMILQVMAAMANTLCSAWPWNWKKPLTYQPTTLAITVGWQSMQTVGGPEWNTARFNPFCSMYMKFWLCKCTAIAYL